MRIRHILLLLSAAAIAYLTLWPVPSEFYPFELPEAPPATGVLTPNDALDSVSLTATVGDAPEDIAIASSGAIYTGIADGHILVLEPGAKDWRPITLTYGHPLGIAFGPDERWLYIADAKKGLLRTDSLGHLERLVGSFEGQDLVWVNDLAVGYRGEVYFTSSSQNSSHSTPLLVVLAHECSGRLFRYLPQGKRLDLLADSLCFPNGVALSRDGSLLYVAETTTYSVRRFALDADGLPTAPSEIWAKNLPGFPDGLNFDGRDRPWVSLVSARQKLLDRLGPHPGLRKVVWRLPEQFSPRASRFAALARLDTSGEVVELLGGKAGADVPFSSISNAVWRGDTLYLGSNEERRVGRLVGPAH